jgi:hypothetical protein
LGEILAFCAKRQRVPILPDGLLLLSGRGRSTIRLFASIGGVILGAIGALAVNIGSNNRELKIVTYGFNRQ